MSSELMKALQRIHEMELMPRLGDATRLSNEALRLMINGEQVSISSFKVRVEDICDDCITLAFAFCDEKERTIVNVGCYELRGAGSTMTIAKVANALNFTVS